MILESQVIRDFIFGDAAHDLVSNSPENGAPLTMAELVRASQGPTIADFTLSRKNRRERTHPEENVFRFGFIQKEL